MQRLQSLSQSSQRESPSGIVYLRKICVHLRDFFGFPQRRRGAKEKPRGLQVICDFVANESFS
jgi:hypothetical protein